MTHADPLATVLSGRTGDPRIAHVRERAARPGRTTGWPGWAASEAVDAWRARGIAAPWLHQREAAEAAWAGHDVVMATGTASGKSLGYWLPALTALLRDPRATVLYLSPTKALAGDQLGSLRALGLGLPMATLDGDTPRDARDGIRDTARLVLTNPDLLHASLLPRHERWSRLFRGLRYVVVDECHGYRGLFGSHVACVLRRLHRVAESYGAHPVFLGASATAAEPGASFAALTGSADVVAVDRDASPRGRTRVVFWEPQLIPGIGENGAPVRHTSTGESGRLLADLVAGGVRTLDFVRSRRGAEAVALTARRELAETDRTLPGRVAAYRGGYLPEERRALEAALRSGRLLGVASTNALELGMDISGLDAVVVTGWPGTRASFWQQAGRAGRTGQDSVVVFVADDDPLDTYLVHHPEALFDAPVEATVLDPTNPHVLAPQLCAAAAELPLVPGDLERFGPGAATLVDRLVELGALRRRPSGWYWTRREPAWQLADLRSAGGAPVRVVQQDTGALLGTVDAGAADRTVHPGAVYLHQGLTFRVSVLDLDEHVALVERADPDYSTQARTVTSITVEEEQDAETWGMVRMSLGRVEVSEQVVAFQRRRLGSQEVLDEQPLDLPARTVSTVAVWWSIPAAVLADAGIGPGDVPGAAHAAEHAAIGLMPLVASCDRWDIGGVSTARHADTGMPTVFIYDGHAGGAGFAARGFAAARTWLRATAEAIASCECQDGCPSCVQSPKCGNGNEPLDKDGAVRLLRAVLAAAGGPARAEERSSIPMFPAPPEAGDHRTTT